MSALSNIGNACGAGLVLPISHTVTIRQPMLLRALMLPSTLPAAGRSSARSWAPRSSAPGCAPPQRTTRNSPFVSSPPSHAPLTMATAAACSLINVSPSLSSEAALELHQMSVASCDSISLCPLNSVAPHSSMPSLLSTPMHTHAPDPHAPSHATPPHAGNTVSDDVGFWSSSGNPSPQAVDCLLYRLEAPCCALFFIKLGVYRADYQHGCVQEGRGQLLKAVSLGAPRPPSTFDQIFGWERRIRDRLGGCLGGIG